SFNHSLESRRFPPASRGLNDGRTWHSVCTRNAAMNSNGEHVTPASTPDVRAEGPLATGERFRPIVLAGMTLALLALCIWLAVPFIPALAWAVALAVIAWPLHTWLSRKTQRLSF